MLGYKAFDENLINRYGKEFELEKEYTIDGEIKFGSRGFHFCTNLEDTLRYVDGSNAVIAIVESLGDLQKYDDEYNGYYDMFVTNKIKIIKVLTKEDILKYMFKLPEFRIIRLISSYFQFNEEDLQLLEMLYSNNDNIMKAIRYYQRNDLDAYKILKFIFESL